MIGIGNDLPRTFGPYTLLRQLAVGGMAEIYLAKAKGIGGFEKLLALKMIHPRFSEDDHFITMLIEEAKISVQLNHVNIGQIFDLGRIEDTYYIAMEYIEGADVYRTLRRASEMGVDIPLDTAIYVAQETCAGLDYAHRKRDSEGKPLKIIHRDVSPQNVIISFAGEVKIVDFGIAKASLRAKETEVGIIKGKYYYMSPEQAWGDPVDSRTDIFSTGIILYEMLTGQMLYMEDNVPALLDRVRKADIAPPSTRRPDIPKTLDDIVMKSLAKYPDDRYATAHELQSALTRFLFSFSPDYTATMLASLVSWLFEDEAKRPAAGSQPAPEVEEPSGQIAIMAGDELSEEAVVPSVIFSLEDVTNVRAARAMAALQKGAADPNDSDNTSRQPALAPATRADSQEEDEDTEVWGDETLIDNSHKFGEIAEEFRLAEARRKAAETAPPPQRGANVETRPVDIGDVDDLSRRRVTAGSSALAEAARPVRTAMQAAPVPPPEPFAPAMPRPAGPTPRGRPGENRPKATLMGIAVPPPPRVSAPPPPPMAPHNAAAIVTDVERDLEALYEGATLAPGQDRAPAMGAAPATTKPLEGARRLSAAAALILDDSLEIVDASAEDPRTVRTEGISETAMTHVAPPAVPGRRAATPQPPTRAPTSRPVPPPPPPPPQMSPPPVSAPPPVPVAPLQFARANTKPLHSGPVLPPDALTRPFAGPPPPDPNTGPLVVHDPFTGSYGSSSGTSTFPRALAWLAGGVFLIGAVVAAVVLLIPARPDPCVLEITSHPPGAEVKVGDTLVSRLTPMRVEGLEPGQSYQLEVRLEGYQPWVQQFQAVAGVVQQIAILEAIRGTLQITSQPDGAQIYIDGVYKGSTPVTIPGLEINRPVLVRAERRGYVAEERRHEWRGAVAASMVIQLRPAPR